MTGWLPKNSRVYLAMIPFYSKSGLAQIKVALAVCNRVLRTFEGCKNTFKNRLRFSFFHFQVNIHPPVEFLISERNRFL